MINKNELIFAVDENNNRIEPVERQKAHAEGIWHRGSDVVVINFSGKILCNKRSLLKDHNPGKWDFSFGGHNLADSEPIQTAINELKEESGLEASPGELEFFGITRSPSVTKLDNQFLYAYVFKWDGDIADLKLEKEEIDEVKWVDMKDLQELMTHNDPNWIKTAYIVPLINKLLALFSE